MTEFSDAPARHLVLEAGAATDVGRRRTVNEDSLVAEFPVYIVADGMGGHAAGDRASAEIAEQFRRLVGRVDVARDDVVEVVAEAHRRVSAIDAPGRAAAGSTLSGLVVVDGEDDARWMIVNVGDSRVYRWSDGRLTQLTVDHSAVQRLIDDGELAESDRAGYRGRNVITRAIGTTKADADYFFEDVRVGDWMLACSDGLTGEVSDAEIAEILAAVDAPQAAADALVARALERGGRDNVSVVVVRAVAPPVDVETASLEWDDAVEDTLPMPGRRGRA